MRNVFTLRTDELLVFVSLEQLVEVLSTVTAWQLGVGHVLVNQVTCQSLGGALRAHLLLANRAQSSVDPHVLQQSVSGVQSSAASIRVLCATDRMENMFYHTNTVKYVLTAICL
jgi:hypothetical protein